MTGQISDRSLLGTIRAFVRTMRPRQWIKNLLVFAPAVFGGVVNDAAVIQKTFLSFAALTLVASAIYFLNDTLDASVDRFHPLKSHRPIASGLINRPTAISSSLALLLLGLGCAYLLVGAVVALWLFAYAVANVAYSAWAKHIVLLDLFVLDFGYLIRLMVGGAAAGIALSQWILLVTAFAAGVLVVGKRRQERVRYEDTAPTTRPIISAYPLAWLDGLLMMCIGATTVFYSLWAFEVAETSTSAILPWTVAPVSFGLIRYGYLIETTSLGEAPERVLFEDLPISLAMLTWIVLTVISLYVA